MCNQFKYDVFLSHGAKDKAMERPLRERLRADRLKVWFDEWEVGRASVEPSKRQAKIEEGLKRSRGPVPCMTANAFGAARVQLEAGTFRFRDRLNKERRFLPRRAPSKAVWQQRRTVCQLSMPESSNENKWCLP